MTRLFLSLAFDEFGQRVAACVREELSHYGVECVIAGDLARAPPPEVVRTLILTCDGLLAVITSAQRDWVQNEIGIAYAARLPVYGLVEEGTEVGGILPRITTYVRFSRSFWEPDIRKKVVIIASELSGTGAIAAIANPTQMLVRSSGTLLLALRPRRIPRGEEIMTIYIPQDFRVMTNEPPNDELYRLVPSLPRPTTTGIPDSACRIALTPATRNGTYAGFVNLRIILMFPQVESYLNGGWAEFNLQYTAPSTAGRYRFFGRDQVLVSEREEDAREASSFDFNPITVQGEVSLVSLVGRIFTSPGVPLRVAGFVRAEMTMRLDPYTGQPRPDLPRVDAVGYIGASDEGKYEVPGIAPGTYNIHASAIGSAESLIACDLRIHRQPQSLDGQIQV